VGGAATARYVWSPVYVNALVLRDFATGAPGTLNQRLWVQQDANWNVTALVNGSGVVVERYIYTPYGVITVLNASWGTLSGSAYSWVYGFQGMRYDPTSGLYESQSRWYSPTLQRWISIDPLRYGAGDADLYRMEGNGPVDQTDPSGMIPNKYGNVMKYQGWSEEDFVTMQPWFALVRAEKEQQSIDDLEAKLADETYIYNFGQSTAQQALALAAKESLAMLESVALDLSVQALEMALSSAISPLGVKIVTKLIDKGWQLFRTSGGLYYLKRGACILRLTTGCLAKGTPLLTPGGWKAIEDFVPGDEILTRHEDDPNGPVHAQVVEAVFHRHTTVLKVVVRGQEVVLTEEHPFFTFRQGWTPAHQLVPGDLILGLDNQWLEVEVAVHSLLLLLNDHRHFICASRHFASNHTPRTPRLYPIGLQ
jgi:RHS repeat-associated protein